MKNYGKKTAFLGLCTALALILAYVEALLPPLMSAVPGIKMGLPNIVIIFLLYRHGPLTAAGVSLVRVFMVALLFGFNGMAMAYSLAGAILSLAVMTLLRRLDFLSTIGVSVAGGVMHNVGQILMAMLLLGTAELGYYLIVLAISGTVAGVLIGLGGSVLIRRVPPMG